MSPIAAVKNAPAPEPAHQFDEQPNGGPTVVDPPAMPLPPIGQTGRIMLGAQVNLRSDSPKEVNSRLGFNLAIVSIAQTIPETEVPAFELLDETRTNAALLLTVIPRIPLANITSQQLKDVAWRCAGFNKYNRTVFLRFAPDFNVNWNSYGMQPSAFLSAWRDLKRYLIDFNATSTSLSWSPYEASDYPFQIAPMPVKPGQASLDTNNNGFIDAGDDPYSPYWPGDSSVDWVGLSVYHLGDKFPWTTNAIPNATEFVTKIASGPFNFYKTYAVGKLKPMMISETGAVYQESQNVTAPPFPGPRNIDIKTAWWRQFITNISFFRSYPQIHMIVLQELVWLGRDAQAGRLLDVRTLSPPTLSLFQADFTRVAAQFEFAIDLPAIVRTWFGGAAPTGRPSISIKPPDLSNHNDPPQGWVLQMSVIGVVGVAFIGVAIWGAVVFIRRRNLANNPPPIVEPETALQRPVSMISESGTRVDSDVDETETVVGARSRRVHFEGTATEVSVRSRASLSAMSDEDAFDQTGDSQDSAPSPVAVIPLDTLNLHDTLGRFSNETFASSTSGTVLLSVPSSSAR
eukprot:jgi/Hompol1/7118/HPOL_005195-RA